MACEQTRLQKLCGPLSVRRRRQQSEQMVHNMEGHGEMCGRQGQIQGH